MLKKILIFIMILLLAYAAYVAGSRGLADIYHNVIKEHISTWDEKGARPDLSIWTEVEDIALSAVSLSPMDSDLLLSAGYIYEWKPTTTSKERQEALKVAMDFYKRSIKFRPVWPIGWRDLASAKFKAGEADEVFLAAFRNAIELGPWEPDILFGMSELGYSAWSVLPKAERELALENNRRALTRGHKQLFALAKDNQKTYLYCYVAKGNEKAIKLCGTKK